MERSDVEVRDQEESTEDAEARSLPQENSQATPLAAKEKTIRRIRLSASVIVALGLLVYLNSFEGAFTFDDLDWVGNSSVQHLWPPWKAMFTSANLSRPLIGLSLAINYAISGMQPWSYHVFNLMVHILAALALFGIVRRTLLSETLRERFGKASTPLALIIALIWMVHPLQTQAVTYVIQRCESLMGMFYLLTLYCAIRSFQSSHRRWWYAAAIAACAAGALSKQVIVTAPLLVLLHDTLFLSGSLKQALRNRWGLYVGLIATWSLLVLTTMAAPVNETAGFAVKSITSWGYVKSQPAVIVYYLRLALWPEPLCLDYGWKAAERLSEILPYAAALLLLIGITLWTFWRRQAVSFPGLWFFLILAPTSSVMPFSDLMFEHRMYLPLAAVVALLVLLAYDFGRRFLLRLLPSPEEFARVGRLAALIVVTLLVTSLSLLTVRRNVDYKNPIVMWRDVVSKRPANARGHNNLGTLLADKGLLDEAYEHFLAACAYQPGYAEAENNLGRTLMQEGKLEEGKIHLQEALRSNPKNIYANFNMGQYLAFHGQFDEAISHFQQILQIKPDDAGVYAEIGMTLERQGKIDEALEQYRRALNLNPQEPDALGHQALILVSHANPEIRNVEEAIHLAEQAVQLTRGQQSFSLYVLAVSYAETGRFPEAIESAQRAKSLAVAMGNQEFAEVCEGLLKLYKEGRSHKAEKSK
jgi:tetratricopeptide (TPR) repeat protein